jgi:predicted nucleic acid-binding protein
VILLDTSVWVDYLRGTPGPATDHVRALVHDAASLAVTEPIVMELLAGAPDERVLERLEVLVSGLPLLRVDAHLDYRDAATIYRTARRRGLTVRKLVDCLIAAVALRTGTRLVHKDVDFEAIASVVPLDAVSLR